MTSFTLGSASFVLLHQRAVVGLVRLDRAVVTVLELVPEVVHADENAQHVRLQVEAIGLPALGELKHLVAADAAIEDLQIRVGPIDQQLRRGEPGIAVAERGLRIGGRVLAAAAGVGDRIALEQDRLPRLDDPRPGRMKRKCALFLGSRIERGQCRQARRGEVPRQLSRSHADSVQMTFQPSEGFMLLQSPLRPWDEREALSCSRNNA